MSCYAGLPAIKRRMKELELALLQYQQNIEIPEVNLVFHPVVQRAATLVRQLPLRCCPHTHSCIAY